MLSELSGVAVRRQTLSELSELSGCCCCQTLGCCCQVLSGGAVGVLPGSHISHTYDTIKRALTIKGVLTPMTPAATQVRSSPPSYTA